MLALTENLQAGGVRNALSRCDLSSLRATFHACLRHIHQVGGRLSGWLTGGPLLSCEEYVEVCELYRRGWSTARISRHLGRDRKTVRSYLRGERTPGIRSAAPDAFLRFLPYCRQRLSEDPHLPAAVLLGEITDLGYPGGYSTFTRSLRKHEVRPPCEWCQEPVTGNDGSSTAPQSTADAAQPTAEAVRFEWLELPGPSAGGGCEGRTHLLLGSLTHSGRWRGALAEEQDLPHLVEAVEHVLRRLGGTPGRWLFDRTPPVCRPGSGRVTAAFARVAEHYGVRVEICPQDHRRHPAHDTLGRAAHRWWSEVNSGETVQDAQAGLDQLAERMDGPPRASGGAGAAAGARTGAEPLRALPPTPFPVSVCADRTVSPQGLVPFRGNLYAVPDYLPGAVVKVRRRLDDPYLSIATAGGAVIARYVLAPQGAGLTVAEHNSVIALERPLDPVRTAVPPCRSRTRRPPSGQALAAAEALRSDDSAPQSAPLAAGEGRLNGTPSAAPSETPAASSEPGDGPQDDSGPLPGATRCPSMSTTSHRRAEAAHPTPPSTPRPPHGRQDPAHPHGRARLRVEPLVIRTPPAKRVCAPAASRARRDNRTNNAGP
ncbi:hypothetical protein ACFC1R_19085 [Kitasatospora sp. NPDC056138]|uniref:Mu transposase domain-containing protein n=1 Tax=Kitasatospora sp. NPDC056138 TaxID=3345724 RepID=UPI0035DA2017